jgi:N-acyl homoserine lactone hydrolase
MADWSIWLLEYARVKEYPVGGLLGGRHNEGTVLAPYCYGVLTDGEHVVLVDCGLELNDYGRTMSEAYGVSDWQPPDVVLGRIGLTPADVDTVVLTHNHFDHASAVRRFPNAHVHIQQREVTKYLEYRSLPARMQWLTLAVDPLTMLDLAACRQEGRLSAHNGGMEIMPGLELRPAHDTHTAGSQLVVVDTESNGRFVFAGDNIYLYESLEGADGDGQLIPIGLAFGSMEQCIVTMDTMLRLVGDDARRVLPFHEAKVWEQFPSREYDDGLHVAEVALGRGVDSRLGERVAQDGPRA